RRFRAATRSTPRTRSCGPESSGHFDGTVLVFPSNWREGATHRVAPSTCHWDRARVGRLNGIPFMVGSRQGSSAWGWVTDVDSADHNRAVPSKGHSVWRYWRDPRADSGVGADDLARERAFPRRSDGGGP